MSTSTKLVRDIDKKYGIGIFGGSSPKKPRAVRKKLIPYEQQLTNCMPDLEADEACEIIDEGGSFSVQTRGGHYGYYGTTVSGALTEFEGCCGIRILNHTDSFLEYKKHPDVLELLFRVAMKATLEWENAGYMMFADIQKEYIPVLEKIGFQKVHSFKNPNSGNTVYLYGICVTKKDPTPFE